MTYFLVNNDKKYLLLIFAEIVAVLQTRTENLQKLP